jgi:chromosome segregation ATPase
VRGRKAGHPAASVKRPTKKAARTAKRAVSAASPKHTPRMGPSPPKVSKDELRAQVEKLERANANLRAKNRDASREAKTTAARIAELEDQVARLEKQLVAQTAAAGGDRAALAPKGRRARHREIDPGDSAPPEVAVEEPAPLDREAETAPANLEEHLGDEAPLDLDAETARPNVEEHPGGEAPLDLETETARENVEERLGAE